MVPDKWGFSVAWVFQVSSLLSCLRSSSHIPQRLQHWRLVLEPCAPVKYVSPNLGASSSCVKGFGSFSLKPRCLIWLDYPLLFTVGIHETETFCKTEALTYLEWISTSTLSFPNTLDFIDFFFWNRDCLMYWCQSQQMLIISSFIATTFCSMIFVVVFHWFIKAIPTKYTVKEALTIFNQGILTDLGDLGPLEEYPGPCQNLRRPRILQLSYATYWK